MEALLQSISRIEWALQRIQPHYPGYGLTLTSVRELGVEEKMEVLTDKMFNLELEIERLAERAQTIDSETEAEHK